jgi:hypothetical protein
VFEFAMKNLPQQDFEQPRDTVMVRIDADTGLVLAEGEPADRVTTRLFRRGEEPAPGSYVAVVSRIETVGLGEFGDDLPLITTDEAGIVAAEVDETGVAPPPPSAGQLEVGSGGLY